MNIDKIMEHSIGVVIFSCGFVADIHILFIRGWILVVQRKFPRLQLVFRICNFGYGDNK